MAFPASILSPPSATPKFPINLFNQKPCRIRNSFHPSCVKAVSSTAQFGELNKENKQKLQIKSTFVKEKAVGSRTCRSEGASMEKSSRYSAGAAAFAWEKSIYMVICYFGHLCFLSDIIFSTSRNYELVIPFGLFVGCFLTDVLEKALLQLLPCSEEMPPMGSKSTYWV